MKRELLLEDEPDADNRFEMMKVATKILMNEERTCWAAKRHQELLQTVLTQHHAIQSAMLKIAAEKVLATKDLIRLYREVAVQVSEQDRHAFHFLEWTAGLSDSLCSTFLSYTLCDHAPYYTIGQKVLGGPRPSSQRERNSLTVALKSRLGKTILGWERTTKIRSQEMQQGKFLSVSIVYFLHKDDQMLAKLVRARRKVDPDSGNLGF